MDSRLPGGGLAWARFTKSGAAAKEAGKVSVVYDAVRPLRAVCRPGRTAARPRDLCGSPDDNTVLACMEEGLWNAVGSIIDLFTPAECANFFKAAGYETD